VIEGADAQAEGQNPLCGDEVAISLNFDGDGETIADIRFRGRGCAISQAATSMLMEMVKGRTGSEVAAMSKADLLEEVGIPAHPGPAQVRTPRSRRPQGRPAPGVGRPRRAGAEASDSTGKSSALA
jgi:NifU-like protein involved in Fe-S cluster formation